jgi:hypothetical protein
VRNVASLYLNKTPISTYTNSTVWTNGYLMLRYDAPYSSVGNSDGAV